MPFWSFTTMIRRELPTSPGGRRRNTAKAKASRAARKRNR